MNIDREKIIKMVLTLTAIAVVVTAMTRLAKNNSQTLADYAQQNPEIAYQEKTEETMDETIDETTDELTTETNASLVGDAEKTDSDQDTEDTSNPSDALPVTSLPGASLNGNLFEEERITYADSFYYEPLSENLQRYITGVSYPGGVDSEEEPAISYDELAYLHILHYDFDGNPTEGELICNRAIAQDLVEIFYELYCNEYHIEKVLLIDTYNGDDTASMEDNNTSCFNYRVVEGSTSLSKHALGLAIDINPFYNPYITYGENGTENISPASATAYADRSSSFPYKIDENDLCYKLFTAHGFTWGGNWNSCKDYQHFQKVLN